MAENENEVEVMQSPGIFKRVRNRIRSRSQELEAPVADSESGGNGVVEREPEASKFKPTDEVTDSSTVLESKLKSMEMQAMERAQRQEERAQRQDEKLAALTEQLNLLTKLMKASSGMSVDESNEPSGSAHSGDDERSYVDNSASVYGTIGDSSVHVTEGEGTAHSFGSALHGDDRGGFARRVIGKKNTPSPPGDSRSEVASSVCTSGGTKFKYGEHWRKEMCPERHISDINRRIASGKFKIYKSWRKALKSLRMDRGFRLGPDGKTGDWYVHNSITGWLDFQQDIACCLGEEHPDLLFIYILHEEVHWHKLDPMIYSQIATLQLDLATSIISSCEPRLRQTIRGEIDINSPTPTVDLHKYFDRITIGWSSCASSYLLELQQMKFDPKKSFDAFVTRVKNMQMKIVQCDPKYAMSKATELDFWVDQVPMGSPYWSAFSDILYAHTTDRVAAGVPYEILIPEVVEKIRLKDARVKQDLEKKGSQMASFVSGKKAISQNAPRGGGKKKQQHQQQKPGGSGQSTNACHCCGEVGHYRYSCPVVDIDELSAKELRQRMKAANQAYLAVGSARGACRRG